MTTVYENPHYTVDVVEATLSEPLGVLVYGLVNKATSVREGEFPYFPQAVQYSDQLSESILELEAKESTVEAEKPAKEADVVKLRH